jgi:hypothetical protein
MARPHHQRLCAHAANAAWDATLVVRVRGSGITEPGPWIDCQMA